MSTLCDHLSSMASYFEILIGLWAHTNWPYCNHVYIISDHAIVDIVTLCTTTAQTSTFVRET